MAAVRHLGFEKKCYFIFLNNGLTDHHEIWRDGSEAVLDRPAVKNLNYKNPSRRTAAF